MIFSVTKFPPNLILVSMVKKNNQGYIRSIVFDVEQKR